ncbi:MAG TPA: hypothetical protein VHN74_11700 [Candidatus Angelobacter sp.]|nr:hypothetical protein [Candidatus Angelobacter sp.]
MSGTPGGWDELGRTGEGGVQIAGIAVIAGIAGIAGIGKTKPFATDEHGRAQTGLDGY